MIVGMTFRFQCSCRESAAEFLLRHVMVAGGGDTIRNPAEAELPRCSLRD